MTDHGTRPAPDFATGERVNWVGTERLFSKPVVIAAARFEHYVTLNLPDGWRYDIADPATGKILLYGAKASELVRLPSSEPPGPVYDGPVPLADTPGTPCPSGYVGCDHDLTVHSADLGCWLCDCTYGRPS